jgi:hypothetical protein
MQNKALFLRNVLSFDALTCVLSGIASLAFGDALAEPLGLSVELQHGSGVVLLAVGAFIAFTATKISAPLSNASRWLVWMVLLGNAAWVLASVLVLVTNIEQPTSLGMGYVIAQALAVAVVAELEYTGLRKTSASTSVAFQS